MIDRPPKVCFHSCTYGVANKQLLWETGVELAVPTGMHIRPSRCRTDPGAGRGDERVRDVRSQLSYTSAFWSRTPKSLDILNLAFQVVLKVYCQGRKVEHTLLISLLASFITSNI